VQNSKSECDDPLPSNDDERSLFVRFSGIGLLVIGSK